MYPKMLRRRRAGPSASPETTAPERVPLVSLWLALRPARRTPCPRKSAHFAVGTYCARITYAVSGTNMVQLQIFEVAAGGDARGAYTSLAWFDIPSSSYMIAGTESGTLEYQSNPSL